jgi:alpha-mannosidase
VFVELQNILQRAQNALMAKLNVSENEAVVWNPHSFLANGVVGLQYVEDIPAKGYKVVSRLSRKCAVSVKNHCIENEYFIVEFNEQYEISRIFDKRACREVLQMGALGNQLVAYEDFPNDFDAWEIRSYYKEKAYPITDVVSVDAVQDGVSAGLKIVRRFEDSTIEQTVRLYVNVDRIDFETVCDWRNEHTLLKAYFPVDVNTDKATFDIQFGSYERPTHRNTSWDAARFEVCAHKYADVSESDYGVAVMTDCKYGYDVEDSTIGLTLLKCATYPDESADKGRHEFTYSLYPHQGECRMSKVEESAYLLNNPLSFMEGEKGSGELPRAFSLVACNTDGVYVETIKKAEDGNGYILRVIEKQNARHQAKLTFGFNVRAIHECDLMENDLHHVDVEKNTVSFKIKPFEILTFRVLVK